MVNQGSLFKGKAAPVKNINKNIGKLPTTSTSLADLVIAAIIKLNAMIDMLVKPATKIKMNNEPV